MEHRTMGDEAGPAKEWPVLSERERVLSVLLAVVAIVGFLWAAMR